MRLVTIDNGNTNPNVAIHEEGVIKIVMPLDQYQKQNDDFVLISSVGKTLSIHPTYDLKTKRAADSFFDMPVNYSPSLGEDRLVAAYGVFKTIKGKEKVLVIDAGTFLTCDLVSSQGFLGGFIFPGIERLLSTYTQSAQLPAISREEFSASIEKNKTHSLAHDTHEAILSAVKIFYVSMFKELMEQHSPDRIILTGGSAKDMSLLFSSKVRSELAHHLIHSALRLIFELHLQAKS